MNYELENDARWKKPGLSAHEVAALMLLGHAPVESKMDLNFRALLDGGLAELVVQETGIPRFTITWNGKEVLRLLRSMVTEQDVTDQRIWDQV